MSAGSTRGSADVAGLRRHAAALRTLEDWLPRKAGGQARVTVSAIRSAGRCRSHPACPRAADSMSGGQLDWTFAARGPFPALVRVACGRLHYIDEDRATGPVVLVHGKLPLGFVYRNFVGPLAAAGHRHRPDHLGFGRSDKPARDRPLRASRGTSAIRRVLESRPARHHRRPQDWRPDRAVCVPTRPSSGCFILKNTFAHRPRGRTDRAAAYSGPRNRICW